MHFTLDDYRKIEAWLQTRTIKDAILPQTTEVNLDDLYPIVLGGINKTIQYKDFMKLGAPNGVAPLDDNGIILSKYLPSYVDDVLEFKTFANFPEEGEKGKIYLACDTNFQYRWSGSQYVTVGKVLELGERNDTAFPGDRGKALEDKAVLIEGELTIGGYKTFINNIKLLDNINLGGKSIITAYPNELYKGEFKVKHSGSEKGFIIKTVEGNDDVLPLEILTTNGIDKSYTYKFPKTNGTLVTGITIGSDNPYTCIPSIDNGLVDLQLNLAKNSTLMLSKHYMDPSNANYIKFGIGDTSAYISSGLVISDGFNNKNIVGEDLFGYFALCEPNNTGEMTKLGYSSVLGLYSVIEENVHIHKGAELGSNVNIQSNALIGEGVKIGGNVNIGNNVEIEEGLKFNTHSNYLEVEVPNSGLFSIKPGITIDKSSSDLVIPQEGLSIDRDVDNDVLLSIKQGTLNGGGVTTTFPLADEEYAGLMSYEDKIKLNKIEDGIDITKTNSSNEAHLMVGSATLGNNVNIGDNVDIVDGVLISLVKSSSTGALAIGSAYLGEDVNIGDGINIGDNTTIPANTKIKDTSIDNFDDLWVSAGGAIDATNEEAPYKIKALENIEGANISLTYKEALVTYQHRIMWPYMPSIDGTLNLKVTMVGTTGIYGSHDTRPNIAKKVRSNYIEILYLGDRNAAFPIRASDCGGFLGNCAKLRMVIGTIDLNGSSNVANMFDYGGAKLPNLTYIQLKNLKTNLLMGGIPKIDYYSMNYLVINATNTAAITIKVHADVYAKLTSDITNAAAAALSTEELAKWTALYTTATNKLISFGI